MLIGNTEIVFDGNEGHISCQNIKIKFKKAIKAFFRAHSPEDGEPDGSGVLTLQLERQGYEFEVEMACDFYDFERVNELLGLNYNYSI